MAKYHINPGSGSVGACKAEKSLCPFGKEDKHFDSPAAARRAFEEVMSSRPLDRSTLKSLTADELRAVLLKEAGEIGLDVRVIAKAALFAKELHKGQFRSAAPWEERPAYIVHPLRNSIRLIRWGSKDPNVILAGILHDTLEDCAEKYCDTRGIKYASEQEARDILFKKLKKDYGARTAEITLKLSNDIQSEEEKANLTVDEKHQRYVDHVKKSITDDHETLVAKLADLVDNGAGLYHTAYPARIKQTRKQATKYALTMPLFREELARNPIKDPVLRRSVFNSIVLIEDRLKAILEAEG